MSGTKAGAAKAVATIRAKDPGLFKRAGRAGGLAGRGPNYKGGFASMTPEKVREAGRRGGSASRRRKKSEEVK